MYEPFEDYGSQQPGETYGNYLQRYKKFLDAQPPYEGPVSSSSSDGLPTPPTSDSDHEFETGQSGTNQLKGYSFSSFNQDSTAAIANAVKIQYSQKCSEIAHNITDENVITKTRSGSTCQTNFYELDSRGNATLSREYLLQNHKQRTPAEYRQKQWLFDLIGRRPMAFMKVSRNGKNPGGNNGKRDARISKRRASRRKRIL